MDQVIISGIREKNIPKGTYVLAVINWIGVFLCVAVTIFFCLWAIGVLLSNEPDISPTIAESIMEYPIHFAPRTEKRKTEEEILDEFYRSY